MSPDKSALFDDSTLAGGLASHQLSALDWLRDDRPAAVLADATGAGKTAVACAFLAHTFTVEGATRALWVTEAHLVPQTLRELRRFLPSLPCAPWPQRRDEALAVISYDMVTRRAQQLVEFGGEVIVLDEASALKNTGARADAAKRVIDQAWQRLALTATPMEVDAMETYRLLRLLGARVPNQNNFERFLQWTTYPTGERKVVGVRPEALPLLRTALEPYVLRREIDELGLELPDLHEEQVWVALTPPQQAANRSAEGLRDPFARSKRLDMSCAAAGGRSAKAEAAVAWLQVHQEVGKAVLYAENLDHLSVAESLLTQAGIGWVRMDGSTSRVRRADAVQVFREDTSIRVLLGSRVLERGIDGLQHAGVLLSLGSSFNPAREAQRIGRLRRPGSPHGLVRHLTFLADTGHERRKWATVDRRAADSQAVLGPSPRR